MFDSLVRNAVQDNLELLLYCFELLRPFRIELLNFNGEHFDLDVVECGSECCCEKQCSKARY